MCCGCGMMIDPGAYVIADLHKGDEITFSPSQSEPNKTLVVFQVNGYSALCTDGTTLNCHDGNYVEKTGRTLEAKPSLKAIKILVIVFFRKIGCWFPNLIQQINNDIFYIRWKLEKKFAHK